VLAADPYVGYRWLREHSPVHFDDRSGTWLLTRHADCVAVLRDKRFSAALAQGRRNRRDDLPPSMLTTDPPAHHRLRVPASKLVARIHVDRCAAGVAVAADQLAAQAGARGEFDAIAAYAAPLSAVALATLLGIPLPELAHFARLARAASGNLDPLTDEVRAQQGRQAADELVEYLRGVLDERRMTPDGGITAVLRTPGPPGTGEARQAGLSRDEVLALLALVVVGGLDPLTHAIGNGLDTLVRSPGQLQRLREHPGLWPSAVEELLRWESPIPFTARVPTVDVTVGGERIGAGETVIAVLAAANRDPKVFDDPDSVDLARSPNPVMAFGAGVHLCLATGLARTVGRIALATALRRLPKMTAVDDEPVWLTCRVPRGLARLPLHVG
jgi:cytochrome P450